MGIGLLIGRSQTVVVVLVLVLGLVGAFVFLQPRIGAPAAPQTPVARPTTVEVSPPPPSTPTGPSPACGRERWEVKTLSDGAARAVGGEPQPTTVDDLRALRVPLEIKPGTPRIVGVETTIYSVRARLVGSKLEDDRDFHVVIAAAAAPERTMIVEFPDPGCPGAAGSARSAEMAAARRAFVAACGEPQTAFRRLAAEVTVTGVGFFDEVHGQTGVAPNGIELHPVLAFEATRCAPA